MTKGGHFNIMTKGNNFDWCCFSRYFPWQHSTATHRKT